MGSSLGLLAAVLGGYVVVVLLIGVLATRRSSRSPEEYYLAGRGLGTLVLFMALFGTNATTFVLIAVPARAYHEGLGIFGVNAPIIALGIPLTFWLIGSPARRMARRLDALTPAELYARRFGSSRVGQVLFGFFTLYTLPYMVQAVKGVGGTIAVATEGAVSAEAAGAGVTVVALAYTLLGGMRATAWTNVLQGAVFLSFMVAAFLLVGDSLGGLAAATEAVAATRPELLTVDRGGDGGALFPPGMWASWGLAISLTVIAFPHMFVRLMAARSEDALRRICLLYPLALGLLWVPAVMLGVWGAAAFPGLEGTESDAIFSLLITGHLPAWLGAVGVLAVLAAVMSTLDAQILTLSSMLVRDVLDLDQRPGTPPARHVAAGRLFAVGIAAVVYVLSLVWTDGLYRISAVAFSGYVTLVPTLLLGVRWRRFTAAGAVASLLAANLVLLLGETGALPTAGLLPVAWAFATGLAVAVVASHLTRAPDADRTARAFGEN